MDENNIIEEIIESVKHFKAALEKEKNLIIEKIKEMCTSDFLELSERWHIFKECNIGYTKDIDNLFKSFDHIMKINDYLYEYWDDKQYISIFDIIELIERFKEELIQENSCTEEEYEKSLKELKEHILDEMVIICNIQ